MGAFDDAWGATPEAENATKLTGFDAAWDAAPEPAVQPSWTDSAKFVGKSLVEGAAKLGDLANWANPFADLFGSHSIEDLAHEYVGKPEDTGITGAVPALAKAAVESSIFPFGGPIANALVGAGSEGAHQAFPDSNLAPIVGAILTGSGLHAAGGVADSLTGAGNAFERASVGARLGDYLASERKNGLLTDEETGDLATKLQLAINGIGSREGWGLWRTPQSMADLNASRMSDIGGQIGDTLAAADAAKANPSINLLHPDSATQTLIGKATATKADLKQALAEILDRFTAPVDGWDGTVAGLNAWKTNLANMGFSGSAAGTLAPAVKRGLLRAVSSDLGQSVTDAVTSSGAASAEDWAQLMSKYGEYATVNPILRRQVTGEASTTWDKMLRGLLRTSGGTLTTPALLAGAVGAPGGAAAGLAAGAALGLVGTPTGQGLSGNVLKAIGAIGSKITEGANIAPLAAITTGSTPIEDLFSEKKAEKAATTEPTPPKTPIEALFKSEAPAADPYTSALIQAESGGDPNAKNPKSSAKGLGQFINSTGKALGITDPYDPVQNMTAIKALTDENKARFQTDNPIILYAAHYLGAPVLSKVLKKEALTTKESQQVKDFENSALPNFLKYYQGQA